MTYVNELLVCRLYADGMTMTDVADKTKCSVATIFRVLKKHNVATRKVHKLTAEKRSEIIKKYQTGQSIHSLAIDYSVCDNNIRQLLTSRGIEIRTRYDKMKNASTFIVMNSRFDVK